MKRIVSLVAVMLVITAKAQVKSDRIVHFVESQTKLMLTEVKSKRSTNIDFVSPRTIEGNELKMVATKDWTSGFFPGVLWYLYDLTGRKEWKTDAERFTALIEEQKTNGTTHDMGFKIYSSFGNGFKLTHDPHYKEVIIQAAKTLATRYNPKAGVLRSWDHSKDKWAYPVIIDNMMNLELLFEAAKLSGETSLTRVAVSHANATMKNHFRADYSSYHVVDYDSLTGKIIKKTTHQGYANESAWARGQSWGLYGFTMCYRETHDEKYLGLAENIAEFILSHPNLPEDYVPYWDFNAPNIPNEPRDVSAAAIMASGLFELSLYSRNGKKYRLAAERMITSLSRSYLSTPGSNHGFILDHSTGTKPTNSEVDVPLIYADYYFLEALSREKKIKEGKPIL